VGKLDNNQYQQVWPKRVGKLNNYQYQQVWLQTCGKALQLSVPADLVTNLWESLIITSTSRFGYKLVGKLYNNL
jgi:hypothetical protein